MQSKSRNLEMRFGWNKHRKSACLGLWLPGRGWITLVLNCEQYTILVTSGGVWILGKWVSPSTGFSGCPGCQSWLYFSKGNLQADKCFSRKQPYHVYWHGVSHSWWTWKCTVQILTSLTKIWGKLTRECHRAQLKITYFFPGLEQTREFHPVSQSPPTVITPI